MSRSEFIRRDRQVFAREVLSGHGIVGVFGALGVGGITWASTGQSVIGLGTMGVIAGLVVAASYKRSIYKRWHDPRFRHLWQGCEDRRSRFQQSVSDLNKSKVAALEELPQTVNSLGEDLYIALRRADRVAFEIARTEANLVPTAQYQLMVSKDPQAQEMYRMADQNIAEYRRQMQAIEATVHRAEAQAAVYMTTLDSLRVRVLGHRLAGREVQESVLPFIQTIAEARMQLAAIDKALEELEVMPYPHEVIPPRMPEAKAELNIPPQAATPPEIPDHVRQQMGDGPQ